MFFIFLTLWNWYDFVENLHIPADKIFFHYFDVNKYVVPNSYFFTSEKKYFLSLVKHVLFITSENGKQRWKSCFFTSDKDAKVFYRHSTSEIWNMKVQDEVVPISHCQENEKQVTFPMKLIVHKHKWIFEPVLRFTARNRKPFRFHYLTLIYLFKVTKIILSSKCLQVIECVNVIKRVSVICLRQDASFRTTAFE